MFDEPSSPFDEHRVPVIPEGLLAKTPKAQHEDEFKTFDRRELGSMDDKKLAQWQSCFQPDEPQWRLAEHEWQIRSGKSARKIAVAAIIISILSVVLAALSYWRPHH